VARLKWGSTGSRFYESGVDRGVLYVDGQGVAWTGLTSVNENPTGGGARSYYIDGIKYLNMSSAEEFEATITAYTYPDEFGVCDGSARVRPGFYVTQQRRKSFGLSYRTKVGNDLDGVDHGYKLHIIYNALAAPANKTYTTLSESIEPNDFSWKITTRPPVTSGYKRTSHVVFDSREADPELMAILEDILYGTESEQPRLPDFSELIDIFETILHLTVTDNGDGTFTVEGPPEAIVMMDETTFSITWPTAVMIDEDSYTLTSS